MERKQTPQEKYNKENTKMYSFRFMNKSDGDIIEKLESVPNKAGYIKTLIRQDIAGGKESATADKLERIKKIIEE